MGNDALLIFKRNFKFSPIFRNSLVEWKHAERLGIIRHSKCLYSRVFGSACAMFEWTPCVYQARITLITRSYVKNFVIDCLPYYIILWSAGVPRFWYKIIKICYTTYQASCFHPGMSCVCLHPFTCVEELQSAWYFLLHKKAFVFQVW